MTFKFPLQRLLDLKARHEQEMARQLASARQGADAERETRDALAASHAASHEHISRATGGAATVGELACMSYTLDQLSERVSAAEERTVAANEIVDAREDELSGAVRDRQVLDRLRDKRLEIHHLDEKARDLLAMDAIALTRFTNRKTTNNKDA